jgi:hypothetical protein
MEASMKVKAIKNYYDLELKKNIAVGEEFEVSAERAKALSTVNNKAGIVLAEVIESTTTDKVAKGRKKKEA